ncbi:fimbrial chaperone protein [Altererythrobacter atlanticus]|uniref:Uncharacterized protein n=1 Tax=Croceibacterium atlanticum TaxID=1267766 RepID=A0A0F7KYL2_9SPHN|nr:fimbria/pilus periplasmic chaperone [Croceibacterium atlanticum]AKH43880.1 hypothetical protein WYH_02853 [Croceibacterium atlanticum]MBB5733670.1 fimbrial chaperone protein [Croceibacterium atlanticum]
MYIRSLLAACAMFAASSAASAQTSLRVQPVTVEVLHPSQATSVSLQNTGTSPVSLQLRIFEWTQSADGSDSIRPTDEVVVSPPAATIPGNSTYTIRVARTAGAVEGGERSYRLWIDEIPITADTTDDNAAVDVRLRYDMPVFFGDPAAESNLEWTAYRSDGTLVVEASNRGTRHARVVGMSLGDVTIGKGLMGYVLPGSTRRWVSPAGAELPPAGTEATLVTEVGKVEVRKPLKIANR